LSKEQTLKIRFLEGDEGAPIELYQAFRREGIRPYEERAIPFPAEIPSLVIGAGIGALPKILEIILGWTGKNRRRRVRLTIGSSTIEIDQATAEERRELIDAWIRNAEGQRGRSRATSNPNAMIHLGGQSSSS
jgi:hypothetical protein